MFPSSFDYKRASSVQEAVSLLGSNANAKLIAGGHSLLPAMKLRLSTPSLLIDISHIAALKGISLSGNTVVIGATTTHAEIAASDVVKKHCAALAEAAALIGDMQVRNAGTIGGSISHADPAADYPAALIALGASVKLAGKGGERTVNAADFFVGLFQTAAQDGEVVTAVHVPAATASAYEKHPHPASGFAVVGVALAKLADGSLSAGVTGACANARPLSQSGVSAADCLSDNYASAEYRAHLVSVLSKRAMARV
jgi:carbon-monoxide dehydrogenase medium subunit